MLDINDTVAIESIPDAIEQIEELLRLNDRLDARIAELEKVTAAVTVLVNWVNNSERGIKRLVGLMSLASQSIIDAWSKVNSFLSGTGGIFTEFVANTIPGARPALEVSSCCFLAGRSSLVFQADPICLRGCWRRPTPKGGAYSATAPN